LAQCRSIFFVVARTDAKAALSAPELDTLRTVRDSSSLEADEGEQRAEVMAVGRAQRRQIARARDHRRN
jgi:hypothetical protein